MELGIHLSDLTWPGGPATLRNDLVRIAVEAERQGFAMLSLMDHVWQIRVHGPPEHDMLEAYTTLGFLAARTERIELLAWVTAASYRAPGLLAKTVTTLDVLSGGRAWLGVGAGWNEDEARGLGLFLPPVSERFEHLEEAVQVCLQMWSGDDGPYRGRHHTLERTLNSPPALRRPHPPILIGGSGERKTLRLVARYAQACNLFAGPEVGRKLDVLRRHCDEIGRDHTEIRKTVIGALDPGARGERVDELLRELRRLADLGVDHYHGYVPDVWDGTGMRLLGERVAPVVAGW